MLIAGAAQKLVPRSPGQAVLVDRGAQANLAVSLEGPAPGLARSLHQSPDPRP